MDSSLGCWVLEYPAAEGGVLRNMGWALFEGEVRDMANGIEPWLVVADKP